MEEQVYPLLDLPEPPEPQKSLRQQLFDLLRGSLPLFPAQQAPPPPAPAL